jgi:hypothetical protein
MPKPSIAPGRIRRVAGRSLIASGLVGAAVFVGSTFYNAGYSTGSYTLYLQNGCAILASFPSELGDTSRNWPHNPYVNRNISEPVRWLRFEVRRRVPSRVPVFETIVPIWTVPLLMCPLGVILLINGERPRSWLCEGRCVRCGYDRRATAEEAACPECGSAKS